MGADSIRQWNCLGLSCDADLEIGQSMTRINRAHLRLLDALGESGKKSQLEVEVSRSLKKVQYKKF